jgi:hypothetical protein
VAEVYYLNWDDEDADGFERAGELFHGLHVAGDSDFDEVRGELESDFDELYRRVGETGREYQGEDDLESVWRDFQAGVGGYTDSLLMRESERSMSVGDVVEMDGDRYVARGIGFSEI